MKRQVTNLLIAFLFAVLWTACTKEKETILEPRNEVILVDYTVTVVSSEGSISSKGTNDISGISGAEVVVSIDGIDVAVVADNNGRAVFTGLKSGNVSVKVSASGYTTVNFTADLGDNNELDAEKRYAGTIVTVFPLRTIIFVISVNITI